MARPLASRVRTQDEFKTLLTTLSMDLGKVTDYLTLVRSLAEAQRGSHWRGMSQSPAFWSTVMWGLHDAGFHGLARAYDQQADALTLRTLLETIKANPPFLSRPVDFDGEQFQKDLKFVDHHTNQAVAHLMIWRHKFFAHRDAGKILNGWTLAEDAALTDADVTSLVEDGFAILNRYRFAFFNTGTSRHVHRHEDYMRLLDTLQAPADESHRQLMEQLRQAEAEAAWVQTSASSASEKPGTSGTDGT